MLRVGLGGQVGSVSTCALPVVTREIPSERPGGGRREDRRPKVARTGGTGDGLDGWRCAA